MRAVKAKTPLQMLRGASIAKVTIRNPFYRN
jgi:hypothetical protein